MTPPNVLMELMWDDLVFGMGGDGMVADREMEIVDKVQEWEDGRRLFFRTQYRARVRLLGWL